MIQQSLYGVCVSSPASASQLLGFQTHLHVQFINLFKLQEIKQESYRKNWTTVHKEVRVHPSKLA